jgi:phenylacetyl-CoA:acceptor oxidoreductase 26-kDa subunit
MSSTNHLQRLQTYWDWRAAGNFICGGAGSGLIVFTCVHAMDSPLAPALLLLGLALVGLGLFSVWLEIGRPWRAMNVFVHLRKSWMSREALAATVLFGLGLGLLAGLRGLAWPMAAAAFAFLYCQVRILSAARGIPVWRDPSTAALLAVTGLAEGVGAFWIVSAWQTQPPIAPALALAALVIVRLVLWEAWRVRIVRAAGPVAARMAQRMAPLARFGAAALPLTLLALATLGTRAAPVLFALAGALVLASGAAFKFALITRMSQQQGFSLPRMPVRGVPRVPAR